VLVFNFRNAKDRIHQANANGASVETDLVSELEQITSAKPKLYKSGKKKKPTENFVDSAPSSGRFACISRIYSYFIHTFLFVLDPSFTH
jgi:tRNA U38,U39,U40 pseudouridine synthase TruA